MQHELELDFSSLASQWTLKEWIQYLFIDPEFSILFHKNRQRTQIVASAWKNATNEAEILQSVDNMIPEISYFRDTEFESPTNAPAIVTKFIGVDHAFCFQKETLTLHSQQKCTIYSKLIFNMSKEDLLQNQVEAPVQILCFWTITETLHCSLKIDFNVRNRSQSWWMEKLKGTISSVLWKQTEENLLSWRDEAIQYLNEHVTQKDAAKTAAATKTIIMEEEPLPLIIASREEEEEEETKSTTSFEDALSTFSSRDEETSHSSAMLLYQQLQQLQMEQTKLQLKCKQLEQEVPALSSIISSMLQQLDLKWKYLQQLQQNVTEQNRFFFWKNTVFVIQLLEIGIVLLYVLIVFRKSIWKFFNQTLFQFFVRVQRLLHFYLRKR